MPAASPKPSADVIAIPDLTWDIPTPLKTGSWRTQSPVYVNSQAPCNMACPAGNDIPAFIQALQQGRLDDAAHALARTQPLPSVCGRVCPAPCMASCNRGAYDGEVNIRALERWVGDHAAAVMPKAVKHPNQLRIAVAGGGPAGLSAAFFLAQAGNDVIIFESEAEPGGLLRYAIPSYRLPENALARDMGRIVGLGVEIRCGETVDAKRLRELAESYDAVVVAVGQVPSRSVPLPGVDLPGVGPGLEFLRRVKMEDKPDLQGHVVVLGGGNTALDCARTAIRCGAEKTTLVYRRGREEMPAIKEEIEEAVAEGVELIFHRQPVGFAGHQRVTGIEIAEVEPGPPDESGRRRPIATDRVSALRCDCVLTALGQYSDLSVFPPEWIIKEARAHIDDRPLNVWTAGDVATGAGTVAHAVGDGKRVACRILDRFGLGDKPADDYAQAPEIVTPEGIRFDRFPNVAPQRDRHVNFASGTADFRELNSGLPDAGEAERCFSCGRCTGCDTCLMYCPEGIIVRLRDGYAFDGDYCKGCGICAYECPRRAVKMTAQGYRSRP
ncbi:MAG: FAD-dependent oxidoreductase [Pseudomonadota bacterium]